MAHKEFVDLVLEALKSSAYIEVHWLTMTGEECALLINEVEPNEQGKRRQRSFCVPLARTPEHELRVTACQRATRASTDRLP